MNTILLAFDSFKGSLTSRQVADAFEEGVRSVNPHCIIRKVSLADGGEGTAEAVVDTCRGEWVEAEVADPLMRPIRARYGLVDEGRTAIVETASASGLTLLADDERNPLMTSTYGTGQLIADALNRGCRKLLVGIGGSATNDGGTGMLSALGFRFLDAAGNPLHGCGASLGQIATIDASHIHHALHTAEIQVACDVTNPFCGPAGAAHVFAPQKGADRAMVEFLDKGLAHFAEVIRRHNGTDVNTIPGAGAAGGLGGAFSALLGAQLRRGVEMVLDIIRFDEQLTGCDLVVTGEGRIDHQTLMGKAPMGVLDAARRKGIPVVAVGGSVEWCTQLNNTSGFASILSINSENLPLHLAMRPDVTRDNLRKVAKEVLTSCFPTH